MQLFTSESVTPGHPDKLCDQISDAILDAHLAEDPRARVAVETMATASGVILAGELRSHANVDHARVAADVVRGCGFAEYALLPIEDRIVGQSPEIGAAVSQSMEARALDLDDDCDEQGAGDQGLMFGYAASETPDLMPLPISLAHALARRLHELAAEDGFDVIGPDGKTQATIAYPDDPSARAGVETLLVSVQHAPSLTPRALRRIIAAKVIQPTLERFELDASPRLLINPSGSFTAGGPTADAGLTGRKIIVDTYGGAARHGGGAFSGKDPSKVDRSGAYAMRWVAKHVVAAGLADRCEVQVAYAIGSARPVSLRVDTFGTGRMSDVDIAERVGGAFDLRPAAIVRDLDLLCPIYRETATFGHFGGFTRPWERLDPERLSRLAPTY